MEGRGDGGQGNACDRCGANFENGTKKAKLTTEDTESSESCYFSLCPLRTLWFFNMQRRTRTMRLHRKARRSPRREGGAGGIVGGK